MSKVYVVKCLSNIKQRDGKDYIYALTDILSVCTTPDFAKEHIKMAVSIDEKDIKEQGIECVVVGYPDAWIQAVSFCDGDLSVVHKYCCEEFDTDTFFGFCETYGTKEGIELD